MLGFDQKKGAQRPQVAVDTLIGPRVVLRGDLVFAGGLHVDGTVVGTISAEPGTEALLVVSDRGRVEGEVRVPHVVIDGTIKGDIHAPGKVELAARARVEGNIHYRLLEMAAGAEVNGRLVHDTPPVADPAPGSA
ncbi:MAG: polymer-forming cytoskeletal protein [Pseudomonadota bacterium]|jgi:cytoskeletal protein CcmA (bactofilin family)